MFKKIIFVFLLCVSIFAAGVNVGGFVPEINTITSVGIVSIDFSQEGTDIDIGHFVINSNSKSFVVCLEFKNGGKFIGEEDTIIPYDIKITETGQGVLGRGITLVVNKSLLPLVDNEFIWEPEDQTSATKDYELKILVSWNGENVPLSGTKMYSETITINIRSIK